jgi:hypothetical protein
MSLHYNLLAADYILVELHDLSEESIPAIDFSCFEQTTCKLILSFATAYRIYIMLLWPFYLMVSCHDYSGSWKCSGFGYTYCSLANHYLTDMFYLVHMQNSVGWIK